VELGLGGVTETAPVAALDLRRPLATGERRSMHLVLVAGPRWPARLATARDLLRRSPARLAAVALGHLARRERFVVHAWEPAGWRAAALPAGVTLRRLSDAEVVAFSAGSEALGTHRAYVERHGVNAAWGLFVEGELAHVSWVLTPALQARLPFATLALAADEVELGNCVTLPRFKGRGLYPLAIALLSRQAFDAGARRVLMVTARHNAASARGIEKAGLATCGTAEQLWLPPLHRVRLRRAVPGMAPAVEWVDLRRAYGRAAPQPARG
jgi:RimJ/RimL family protein N-acetyltransferase